MSARSFIPSRVIQLSLKVRQSDRQTGRQADRQTGRQADRQTDRQTDRQARSRQAGRQIDRQTDRQTDSHTVVNPPIHIHMCEVLNTFFDTFHFNLLTPFMNDNFQ